MEDALDRTINGKEGYVLHGNLSIQICAFWLFYYFQSFVLDIGREAMGQRGCLTNDYSTLDADLKARCK